MQRSKWPLQPAHSPKRHQGSTVSTRLHEGGWGVSMWESSQHVLRERCERVGTRALAAATFAVETEICPENAETGKIPAAGAH